MDTTTKTQNGVPDKVAAFGALVILLSEAVKGGEWEMQVDEATLDTIYTLRLPVWEKLSTQSEISLSRLIKFSDRTGTQADAIFRTYTFRLRHKDNA